MKKSLAIGLLLSVVIGCEQTRTIPIDMKFRDTYVQRVSPSTNPSTFPPVIEGKLPLLYLVNFACTVRVMDQENNKALVVHEVGSGELISVDSKKGIQIGNDFSRPISLDPNGRYAIYLDQR